MKRKLTLLFLLGSVWAYAQDTGFEEQFDLEECIEYALANSIDLQNARLDEQIATAKVKETIGLGLPQITGSVSVQHSPTQPRFFGEYNPDQDLFGLGVRNPQIEAGDVGAAENFFQLKSAGDAGLNINQLIFNGSYFVGLQASQAFKDLSVKETNQTKEQVVLQVSKAYYNLLINQQRLTQLGSNMARVDSLYRNTMAMQQSGFAEKLDVDRIKVTLNNLKVENQNLENIVKVSEMMLKFQMNYPYDQELAIVDNLDAELVQEVITERPDEWSYEERPDYQVLEANQRLQQLNIKNKYAEALPVISGFINAGYSTQSPGFGGLFVTNGNFEDINGVGPDKWYGYSTLGLRLSWNVFTGLQRTYQIQQEKLALQQVENGFKTLKKSIDLEVAQSRDNLATALERLEVQQENMALARDIYDISQIKYEQGVGSNLEVIEADDSYKEAQTNYYNALYDAIVAQLELKKALGILYN